MNSRRRQFSWFWALIGALVLLVICITPAHPMFIIVWGAVIGAGFAGFYRRGPGQNGPIYRDQVRSFGIGMFALTAWFAFEDGRTYAPLVGALLSVLVFWLSRMSGLSDRPVEPVATGVTTTPEPTGEQPQPTVADPVPD